MMVVGVGFFFDVVVFVLVFDEYDFLDFVVDFFWFFWGGVEYFYE